MKGRPKGSVKKWLIQNSIGAIEDVYNTSTSFNVYRLTKNKIRYDFYKSCYSLNKAKEYLKELTKQALK